MPNNVTPVNDVMFVASIAAFSHVPAPPAFVRLKYNPGPPSVCTVKLWKFDLTLPHTSLACTSIPWDPFFNVHPAEEDVENDAFLFGSTAPSDASIVVNLLNRLHALDVTAPLTLTL